MAVWFNGTVLVSLTYVNKVTLCSVQEL